jgi:hypothetical protein
LAGIPEVLMNVRHFWTIALSVLFIASCSSSEPPPPPARTATFADPLLQQKERARDVQNIVDQNSARTRTAVDSQERGDPPP